MKQLLDKTQAREKLRMKTHQCRLNHYTREEARKTREEKRDVRFGIYYVRKGPEQEKKKE